MLGIIRITRRCNYNCSYCFDTHKENKDMSLEMIREICKKNDDAIHNWTWFGGEALLRPLSWFEEAMKIIRQYNNVPSFSIQTNGELLNDEIVFFLLKENIHLSISYDGYGQIERCKNSNVENNIRKYSSKIPIYVICVVNKQNKNKMLENYLLFKELGISGVAFNPLCECPNASESIDDTYIKSFTELFNYWIQDEHPIEVRQFKVLLDLFFGTGKVETLCNRSGKCTDIICIDPDGEIYPCDRFFYTKTPHVNIKDISCLSTYSVRNDIYEFRNLNNERAKQQCDGCFIKQWCNGGCLADASMSGNRQSKEFCVMRHAEVFAIFNVIKNMEYEDVKNPLVSKLFSNNRTLKLIRSVTENEHNDK